jgi:hypothetical protein
MQWRSNFNELIASRACARGEFLDRPPPYVGSTSALHKQLLRTERTREHVFLLRVDCGLSLGFR